MSVVTPRLNNPTEFSRLAASWRHQFSKAFGLVLSYLSVVVATLLFGVELNAKVLVWQQIYLMNCSRSARAAEPFLHSSAAVVYT